MRHLKILIVLAVLASCKKEQDKEKDTLIRPITSNSSKYIDKVYEYLPAPGQFVNESIGNAEAVANIVGDKGSLLHLGAFGGYVIFGFDHSIVNRSGMDIAILGNPVAPPMEWSEPGIVMVSRDVNGNGLPDDPFYELAGSEYAHPSTKKNYRITYFNPKAEAVDVPWRDSEAAEGFVEVNQFHRQNYYPLFAANQDSISFSGTLIRNSLQLLDNTGIFINTGFESGYADCWVAGDANYNSFDIDRAVDESGNHRKLEAIDFVKVYTAQNNRGSGTVGEISTEIRGAFDLHMP